MSRHWRGIALIGGLFLASPAPAAVMGLNPSSPNLFSATAYGVDYANNAASAMCLSCHSANPKADAGTHFVVHFTGAAMRTTGNIGWEKISAWASGGLSRYAVPAPPAPTSASVTGQQGEMICESCHHLSTNVSGGNLLLDAFATDPSYLCHGCHAGPATGPPNHHPLTGDNVGADEEVADSHTLSTQHESHVKAVPTEGSGGVRYPSVDAMGCMSCHVAHGASQGAGARIIRVGYSASTDPLITGKGVNVVTFDGVPEAGDIKGNIKIWNTGDAVQGIDRQQDVTSVIGSPYRLVTDEMPLCDACHAP